MTNFFFGILSILLILLLLGVFITDDIKNDIRKLKPYNGYIVTDKDNGNWFFYRNYTTLRKDTLTHGFISDGIIFDTLKLGDTIKVK